MPNETVQTVVNMGNFLDKKFRWALLAGAVVFAVSLVIGWLAFRGKSHISFFLDFPEWGLAQARNWQPEADISFNYIVAAIDDFVNSINNRQVASIGRWTTGFAILPLMLLLGSRFTSLRHQVYSELGQKKLFDRRQGDWKNTVANVTLSLAMLVSVYVLLSILLLLLNRAFLTLNLTMWGAVIVLALMTGIITFGIMFWASSMNTRDVLTMGLLTLASGILSGFAIAGQGLDGKYAWQHAISRLGEIDLTNWLFAGTLISTVMILSVLAYQLSGFVVVAAKVEGKNGNYQQRVLAFYIVSLLGILAVGLIPANSSLRLVHMAGAIGGFATMISMIVYLVHDLADPVFSNFTRYATYVLGGVAFVAVFVFVGGKAFPLMSGTEKIDWGITLTGVELVLLGVAGMLLVLVVDSLLNFADLHHKDIR